MKNDRLLDVYMYNGVYDMLSISCHFYVAWFLMIFRSFDQITTLTYFNLNLRSYGQLFVLVFFKG